MFKLLEVLAEICHVSPLAALQCSCPTSPLYFQLSNSLFFSLSDEILSAFQD